MKTSSRFALHDRLLTAALAASLAAAALFWSAITLAEDIDIKSLPNVEGLRPYVLITLDNNANWSASPTGQSKCDSSSAKVDSKHVDTRLRTAHCVRRKAI